MTGSSVIEARAALADSDCVRSESEVSAAYDALAGSLTDAYQDLDPLILTVMIGGLVPAAEILRRVGFAFDMDYLHATRYRGATSGGELVWKRRPNASLEGRHVLVIDDILDEGHTLVAIREALLAQAPASLRIAVLAEKIHTRRAQGAHAEFIGLDLPDRYVFGCGMDYKGYWRQLPEIRAIQEAPPALAK